MRRLATLVTQWEWLILLLLLGPLLFPAGWRGLLLLALPLLWFTHKIATGHFVPPTPFNVSLLMLSAALLLSLGAVFDITSSFVKIAGLILGLAFFWAGVSYTRIWENGIWHLTAFIVAVGSGMTLAGALARTEFIGFGRLAALAGGEINPNELAGVSVWFLPLLLAITAGLGPSLWRRHGWKTRLLVLLLLTLTSAQLLLLLATASRGALLGALAAVLVMTAMTFRRARWLLALAALVMFLAIFYFDPHWTLFSEAQGALTLGLAGRLEIWSRALFALTDFPLTGVGMNNFRRIVHTLYPLFSVGPDVDVGHAHNHLLQAGLDLGMPGMVAYLSLWIVGVTLLWRGWRMPSQLEQRVLLLGLSGSFVASWVFGILDAIALGARPGFLWWLLLALLVSVFDDVRMRARTRAGLEIDEQVQRGGRTGSPLRSI